VNDEDAAKGDQDLNGNHEADGDQEGNGEEAIGEDAEVTENCTLITS
jgi:hypothetical protein